MNTVDRQYEDLLADVLKNGVRRRTHRGRLSVFGRQLRYDLKQRFSAYHDEVRADESREGVNCCGSCQVIRNTKWLKDNGISIDEWADGRQPGPRVRTLVVLRPALDGRGIDRSTRSSGSPEIRLLLTRRRNVGDLTCQVVRPSPHVCHDYFIKCLWCPFNIACIPC